MLIILNGLNPKQIIAVETSIITYTSYISVPQTEYVW